MRELVEERLALRLAQALADDLPGDLGADAAEVGRLELLVLDEVAELGLGVVLLGLVEVHSVVASSTSATTERARKMRIWPVSMSRRT